MHDDRWSVSKICHGSLLTSINHKIPRLSIRSRYLRYLDAIFVCFSRNLWFGKKPASPPWYHCFVDSNNWARNVYWRKSGFRSIQKQFPLEQPILVWMLLIVVRKCRNLRSHSNLSLDMAPRMILGIHTTDFCSSSSPISIIIPKNLNISSSVVGFHWRIFDRLLISWVCMYCSAYRLVSRPIRPIISFVMKYR